MMDGWMDVGSRGGLSVALAGARRAWGRSPKQWQTWAFLLPSR